MKYVTYLGVEMEPVDAVPVIKIVGGVMLASGGNLEAVTAAGVAL